MPLRCVDPEERDIHAFDLTPAEWRALAGENRGRRHLRLPCCQSSVILRVSKLGTQHFVHKASVNCHRPAETEVHRLLKRMVVAAARDRDWHASTEVSGSNSAGARWRADVVATKRSYKVAVEVQWSHC